MRYPGHQSSDRGHFLGVRQLCLQHDRIGDIRHYHHKAVHRILLVAHGAKTHGKMAHRIVAAPHAQLQIFDLLTVRRRFQRSFELRPMRRFHPIHQPVADHLVFPVARLVTPRVGIRDETCRVQHQDHALRRVQDFLVEVALALQLSLEVLLFRHVEHQPADLCDLPFRVAYRGHVLQRVQQRSVLPPQRFFVVAQHAPRGQRLQHSLARRRIGVQVRAHVGAQQFLARPVPQHAHHRVVHIQESSVRGGKKKPFLDAVKQVPVTSFCLASVGNVFQYVNRSDVVGLRSQRPRCRDQVHSLGSRKHVLFPRAFRIVADRAGQLAPPLDKLAQPAHRFPHQRHGWRAEHRGERTVRTHDPAAAVVHHDVVADRVDVFHPLPL